MTGDRPPETMTMRVAVGVVVAVVVVLPFVLVGGGVWLLVQRQLGEQVEAEVISCGFDIRYKTSSQHCTARWTQDGVERIGPIQGSGSHEVGERVDATVRGDELYSRSLTLPLVLIGLGAPLLFFPIAWLRRRTRRGDGPAPAPPSD